MNREKQQSRWIRGTIVLAVALAGVLAGPSAMAQNRSGSSGSGENAADTQVRNEGGRRVYVSSRAIEVRGEIQRPYAFLLSGRGSLGYTYFDQAVHFVQEIVNAVRRAPF